MTKRQAYIKGRYKVPVPPVPTRHWTENDWIRFIDRRGIWTVRITEGEK